MENFMDSTGMFLNPNFSFENASLDGFYVVTDEDDLGDSEGEVVSVDKVLVPVLFSILAVVGIASNSVALTMMYKKRSKLSVTDIYLISHFVTNILFLTAWVPFIAVAYGLTDWVFGDVGCKGVNYGMTLCLAVSVLSVTVACLHHGLGYGTGHNDKTLLRNHRSAKVITTAVWLVAAITMIPRVFLYSIDKRWNIVDERRFCTRNQGDPIFRKVDTCVTFLSLFFVPLLVQAACHVRTVLERRRLAIRDETTCSRLTVAKQLAGISAVIFIGWLPTQVINFSEDFTADKGGGAILFPYREVVAFGFSYAAMAATPVVFCFYQRRSNKGNCYNVSRSAQALVAKGRLFNSGDVESGDALISDFSISQQKITAL